MKKLGILLLILVVLAIVADNWVRGRAEERLATELQSSFNSGGEVEVSLGGFPFVVRAMSGNLPAAEIRSPKLVREGIRFTDVTLTFRDLKFSLAKLLDGNMRSISIGSGEGRVSIDEAALSKATARTGHDIDIEIVANGVRLTSGPVSGVVPLTITEEGLVLPIAELGRLAINQLGRLIVIPLPDVIGDLTYESVEIVDDRAELAFTLDDVRLTRL